MSHVSVGSAWGAASLRWALPLAIGALGVSYQILIGEGFEGHGGGRLEHVVDLFLFGLVMPALAYRGWKMIARGRQAAHLLSAITIASPDAFVSLDRDGRVRFWSRGAEVLLGYPARHAGGRTLWELLGPRCEPLWLQLRDMVHRSGLVRGHEAACHGGNGRELRVEISASPILDDAGQSRGMLVILRDISGRGDRGEMIAQLNRRLTEKVQQLAQANAALDQANRSRADLLSLALHEVRAPLAGIAGAAEMMESACDKPTSSCTRMLGVVRGQLRRLDSFAGQVLKAAQIEAGSLVLEREPTTVAAIVQPVVESFRAGNPGRELRATVPSALPAVYADRDCLAQVLCNLLGNADKYSPPEGVIEIEARVEGTLVRLSVRDHGPGLGAEEVDRVFEKFYRAPTPETRAACGHGLGLYISREIVLGHGGDIRAENHPEGGAVFSFTIPVLS